MVEPCVDAAKVKRSPIRDVSLRIIGALQLLGGITGSIMSVVCSNTTSGIPAVSIMVLFVPSAVVATAGWFLWHHRLKAIRVSAVLQALQIVQVTRPFFNYDFHFGAGIQLMIFQSDWDLKIKLGASSFIGPPDYTVPLVLGFNLFAICAFLFLLFEWRATRIDDVDTHFFASGQRQSKIDE
jgi:hypothetical protein